MKISAARFKRPVMWNKLPRESLKVLRDGVSMVVDGLFLRVMGDGAVKLVPLSNVDELDPDEAPQAADLARGGRRR